MWSVSESTVLEVQVSDSSLFFLLPVSHRRLVQLSSRSAGLLEADGAADRTRDGSEAALRRHGVGKED